jgi:two-component system, chemotaxis family, chemotaxis protein CheY
MNSDSPAKKIVLVGHCGPDATYLRIAVRSALGEATFSSADDRAALDRAIQDGVDLILFNRELDYGFEPATGVEMIRVLKQQHPDLKMVLITNYPEVQAAAIAAGGMPGFGKRDIGSPHARELLRGALE